MDTVSSVDGQPQPSSENVPSSRHQFSWWIVEQKMKSTTKPRETDNYNQTDVEQCEVWKGNLAGENQTTQVDDEQPEVKHGHQAGANA